MVKAIEPGSYARPWDPEDPKVSEGDPPDVIVRLRDQRWPFWYDEMTARQQRAVRAETGTSAADWIVDFLKGGARDLDAWCVLCWLARMQAGENVTLADVEDGMKVGDDYGIEGAADEEAPPEA